VSIATHPVAPEEIMALLDAELPAEHSEFVAAHLAQCGECSDVAKALRRGSRSLVGWVIPAAPVNAQFESRLRETARRITSEKGPFEVSRIGAFLRRRWIVAAFSAACGMVLLFKSSPRPMQAPKASPVAVFLGSAPRAAASAGAAGKTNGLPWGRNSGLADSMVEHKGLVSPEDRSSRAESLQQPMIARTVSLSIVAKDFASSRTSLDAILARHHSYAASLNANTQENVARSLQASLRIPAAELDAAIMELKSLGYVQNETQNGEEVTRQHADLVALIKNSRETERRLQAILEQRTGKIRDVLEVEQEIARVRGEIEQMEAEQEGLEHRVAFASVDLTLAEEYKAQIGSPSPAIATRIHNAMVKGYRDATETLIGIAIFFAEYGPSLLIWLAVLVPVGWFFVRRWLRARYIASVGA
jgi:anti-sigma factor RsiW